MKQQEESYAAFRPKRNANVTCNAVARVTRGLLGKSAHKFSIQHRGSEKTRDPQSAGLARTPIPLQL